MEYRDRSALDQDLVRFKLTQARDSLDQAKSLLAANMDIDFVANGVFYTMYYAVLALFQKRNLPPATQNVTIGLFDQEFVQTGIFDWRYSQALHRGFELRKTCSCEDRKNATRNDIDDLLPVAVEFVQKVESMVDTI
jgi:uncharacterized protein (UPF0332 family)